MPVVSTLFRGLGDMSVIGSALSKALDPGSSISSAEDLGSDVKSLVQSVIPGSPTPVAPAAKQSDSQTSNSKTSTANKATDEQSLPAIEQQAMAPYEAELSALPAEYQAAMAGLGETVGPGEPGSSTPGTGQLASAETAENNAQATGDEGIYNALTKEVSAGQTAVKDLPYSDIVTSLLANAKNQIQYGSTPSTYSPNEAAWSNQMKEIYSYLQGTSATTSPTTGASIPGLPTAAQAAQGSDVGSVPGSGGAGVGQA